MLKDKLKKLYRFFLKKIKRFIYPESYYTDALFAALYNKVHDLDSSFEIIPNSTKEAFNTQWVELPKGKGLLSDNWFKENVSKFLTKEELLIDPFWFKNKNVLDAGCGNGRWSYAFSQLGSNITCVDANLSALDQTKKEISNFSNKQNFIHSDLEDIQNFLKPESFDLVFCWGVLHHCKSFNKSLNNISRLLRKGGIIYLYLYGKDSSSFDEEIDLFKQRLRYNLMLDRHQRRKFLLSKTRGRVDKLHIAHDNFAPLINRRFSFKEISDKLCHLGYENIHNTIDYSEIFVKATKGKSLHKKYFLNKSKPPYWFQKIK